MCSVFILVREVHISERAKQGLDGINHSIGLEYHDERLDWEECMLNDASFVFFALETTDPRVFGFGGFPSVQLGLSPLVPQLLRRFKNFGAKARRCFHHALPFDLKSVPDQVCLSQLLYVFVYEYNLMFGGV